MLHDERTYSRPMEFRPERFLATEGHEPEKDPRTICFGFGEHERVRFVDVVADKPTPQVAVSVLVSSSGLHCWRR